MLNRYLTLFIQKKRERWWSSLSVLFSLNQICRSRHYCFFSFFFPRVNITLVLSFSLKWNICKFKNTRRQNDCWKSNTVILRGMVKICLSTCIHNILKGRFFVLEINSPFWKRLVGSLWQFLYFYIEKKKKVQCIRTSHLEFILHSTACYWSNCCQLCFFQT